MVRTKWASSIMEDFNGNLPKIAVIHSMILNVPDELTRIFCILSYLTGGRIAEITNYSEEQYIKKAKRNRKGLVLKNSYGKTVYEWIKRNKKDLNTAKGIMKKNIKLGYKNIELENGQIEKIKVVEVVMRNEKNRSRDYKTIYTPYEKEKKVIDVLMNYLQNLDDDEVIVNVDRRKIYNYFIKHAGHLYYPHFIRALRVGVLMEYYNLKDYQIVDLMGWTNMQPLKSYYIFRKDKSILRSFVKMEIKESNLNTN